LVTWFLDRDFHPRFVVLGRDMNQDHVDREGSFL
jgi:hypothetical protein